MGRPIVCSIRAKCLSFLSSVFLSIETSFSIGVNAEVYLMFWGGRLRYNMEWNISIIYVKRTTLECLLMGAPHMFCGCANGEDEKLCSYRYVKTLLVIWPPCERAFICCLSSYYSYIQCMWSGRLIPSHRQRKCCVGRSTLGGIVTLLVECVLLRSGGNTCLLISVICYLLIRTPFVLAGSLAYFYYLPFPSSNNSTIPSNCLLLVGIHTNIQPTPSIIIVLWATRSAG